MKKRILDFCNTIVTLIFLIGVFYISFFTEIPSKTCNVIKEKYEEYNNNFEEYSSDFRINELGIKFNTYYYNQLTDGQKAIYSSIANAVKNFQTEFVVRNYTAVDKDQFAGDVAVAIGSFLNDHPEAFYLQSNYSSYVIEKFEGCYGYIKLNYTEENVDEINSKVSQIAQKVNNIIQGVQGTTDYDKELYLHDYIANNSKYYHEQEDKIPRKYHTIEGTMLEDLGVCDSFTKVFQILLDREGINSIIVLGNMGGTPHAWNMVELDNEWYHCDITSSRSIYDDTGVITHAYFNITDERELKFCTFDNPELLPTANGTKYNFYNYNNFIANAGNLEDKIEEVHGKLNEKRYLEFYFDGNVTDSINDILKAVKRVDSGYMNGNKMSYYNIENAVIIPKI